MPRTRPKKNGRPDLRYKDADTAPMIVSEKRLTFFLPETTFRALRLQTGYFQVTNAEGNAATGKLPETPSALVREAIEFWLDQFAKAADKSRSEEDWKQRMDELRRAVRPR